MPTSWIPSHHQWTKMPGEHPQGDKFQAALFMLFLGIWISDSILHYSTWLNHVIPLYLRLSIGLSCIILSYYILRRSEADLFFRPANYQLPVYHGIYRYCRHPMYLGDLIFHVGLGIMSISVVSWMIFGISIGLYSYLSQYEEQRLIQEFGDKYLLYQQIVPKWIPSFARIMNPNLFEHSLFKGIDKP
ncbi:hypothetical protein NEF87_002093 [Candidatus Lokiarchaeum ossiferum]|uniref:Isoprenylcysteine carboxylmethyltransferase family protein n=1 Tax=Candidatus Lokiarchaeum ossiferum TaxID=2951803 RepID=A0ABY6HQM9_9ARCH|nr:hypothetical protein NEF87_002093 [Candidatus Lokiarchaeum sp. B-35]